MKKITLSTVVLLMLACLVSMTCFADVYEYYPNEDGCYTVNYQGEAYNEYIIIVVKGVYDETNYVEAYNAASEDDILYYEQITSLSNGGVVFGPFVPKAYFDSTVIIGGTSLSSPCLAGYMRAAGISNVASVKLQGIEEEYCVQGLNGEDIVIEAEAVLLDSFGYPAITDEMAVISVETGAEGVTVDTIEGTVTIDKCAKEGEFTVTAAYGEHTDSKTVRIVREEAKAHSVLAYTSEETKVPVTDMTVELIEDEDHVRFALYSETYDQYGDLFEENRRVYSDSPMSVHGSVISIFTSFNVASVSVVSESDSNVLARIKIKINRVPAYTGNALELHTLIKECEAELALLGVSKFISTNGKDIYPDYTWTTEAKKTAFEGTLASAKTALSQYSTGIVEDTALASNVTALASAKNTYIKSFAAGIRVDITSLSITNNSYRIPVTSTLVGIGISYSPSKNTDTITWKSSDPETVYVDEQGRMVAKENGTVIITATTSTGITASTTVTAYTKATRIQLAESSYSLVYGDEPFVLNVVAYPATQSEILTWSSSRPDIATVDASGTITPQCKAGKTKILVVGEHGLAAECEITVSLPAWETVAAPVASISEGTVFRGTEIELSTTTEGASIFYTLDGSEPTVQSRPYVSPIVVNSDMTVKAIAVADRMFDSSVSVYEYKIVTPEISIGKASVAKGYSATVDITISNNPGVKMLLLELKYPEGITVSDVKTGSALSGLGFECGGGDGVYNLVWSGSTADSTDGVMASVTFDVAESVEAGDAVIEIAQCFSQTENGSTADFEFVDGTISVSDVIIGDVNGDESIDIRDVVLLAQYCVGREEALETANVAASYIDSDDIIDIRDVVLLAQYCAGWDVTIG